MRFGERIREWRKAKYGSRRALDEKVGLSFTYVSKNETEILDFAQFRIEELIHRLAEAFHADEDELLLLAPKIPEQVRARVFQQPNVFRAFAACDDMTLDKLMVEIG